MSGYSWMNSFTPTHFGKSALEGGRNYTKNEQEKKNREMKFLNDQKMLEKLTLEVANLPAQQEQNLRLGEAQIGQSLAATESSKAATDYQKLVTAIEKDFGRAQRQAGINAQNASAGASYASQAASQAATQGALINNQVAMYGLAAAESDYNERQKLRDIGIFTKAGQDLYLKHQVMSKMEKELSSLQGNGSDSSESSYAEVIIPSESGVPISIGEFKESLPVSIQISPRTCNSI